MSCKKPANAFKEKSHGLFLKSEKFMTECVSLKKQHFDESFVIHYFLWKAVWKQQENLCPQLLPFKLM